MDRFEVGFNVDVNDEWPPVGVEFLWLAISSNGYQVWGNGVRSKLLRYPTYHALAHPLRSGSMPFCVELDNLKDTDAPIHQPAAMLVAAD